MQTQLPPQFDFVIFGLKYHFGPLTLRESIRALVNRRPHWLIVFGCDSCGYICTDAQRCYCCAPRGGNSRPLAHTTGSSYPHHAICEVPIFLEELAKDENFVQRENGERYSVDNDNET